MNAFHLAVILIRFLGVWSLIDYAPYLTDQIIRAVTNSDGSDTGLAARAMSFASSLLGIALAVFCIVKSTWLARIIARGCFPAGCCECCGYNLRSSNLTVCPECGHRGVERANAMG